MNITVQYEAPQPTPVKSMTLVLTPQEFRLLRKVVGHADIAEVENAGFGRDELRALYHDLCGIYV